MKQKIFILLIALLCVVILVSCKKLDPVSEKIIADIEAIGEVELDDEEKIVKIEEIYNNMSNNQKDQVKNYIDFINAKDELEKLKKEAEENEIEQLLNSEPYASAIADYNKIYESDLNIVGIREAYYEAETDTLFFDVILRNGNVSSDAGFWFKGTELEKAEKISYTPNEIEFNWTKLDTSILKRYGEKK